jgi:hypothetical protein
VLTSLVCALLALAPLRLTFWILAGATAVIVVLNAILIARRGESARADRGRERVRGELGPLLSGFFQTEDPVRLAEDLRPAFLRMNGAERPVAAALITDLMQAGSASQTEQLRRDRMLRPRQARPSSAPRRGRSSTRERLQR